LVVIITTIYEKLIAARDMMNIDTNACKTNTSYKVQ